MSAFWKVMVGLLLTLPVAAYVTGTFVASQADLPDRRSPVVISDSPSEGVTPSQAPTRIATEQPEKKPPKSTPRPTQNGDDGDGRRAEDQDGDKVRIVRPTPKEVGDDDFDDDDSRDDDRDDDGDDDASRDDGSRDDDSRDGGGDDD